MGCNLENTTQDATIYLTDQVKGHPNIKAISREIMFSVYDFYRKPNQADGFRKKMFTDYHRLAEDSAGFQILMGKFASMETLFKDFSIPKRTVDIYKRIGITSNDLPIQLDIPPRYNLPKEETLAIVHRSAEFYHFMRAEIPEVIPVVHGWTLKELQQSLEWIEDPDRLASGTNIGPAYRSLDVMTKKLAAGTNKAGTGGSQYILDHVTSNKSHLASGAFQAMTKEKQWVMGYLNPHSSVKDRVATGAYQQSGEFVCNGIANTPERMKRKAIASGTFEVMHTGSGRNAFSRKKVVATGAMAQSPVVVDYVVSSKPKVIAAGANQQSGRYVLNEAGNLKAVASPAAAAEEIITTIDKANRKKKAGIPKKHRAPQKVVIERLALVLNLLRDRELFILGGASPHFQHMIFMGGAKYSDTSSWRLKAYMASIYLPEVGARSIGYKETDTRIKEHEIPLLRSCLRNPTHPLNGMSVEDFLALGKMNVKGYYATVKAKEWPCKPFDARALHNAWVLKCQEEPIANEYACNPDGYYHYLMNRRFKGRPNLTRRCSKLWSLLKHPYVQDTLDIYLKGRK